MAQPLFSCLTYIMALRAHIFYKMGYSPRDAFPPFFCLTGLRPDNKGSGRQRLLALASETLRAALFIRSRSLTPHSVSLDVIKETARQGRAKYTATTANRELVCSLLELICLYASKTKSLMLCLCCVRLQLSTPHVIFLLCEAAGGEISSSSFF